MEPEQRKLGAYFVLHRARSRRHICGSNQLRCANVRIERCCLCRAWSVQVIQDRRAGSFRRQGCLPIHSIQESTSPLEGSQPRGPACNVLSRPTETYCVFVIQFNVYLLQGSKPMWNQLHITLGCYGGGTPPKPEALPTPTTCSQAELVHATARSTEADAILEDVACEFLRWYAAVSASCLGRAERFDKSTPPRHS